MKGRQTTWLVVNLSGQLAINQESTWVYPRTRAVNPDRVICGSLREKYLDFKSFCIYLFITNIGFCSICSLHAFLSFSCCILTKEHFPTVLVYSIEYFRLLDTFDWQLQYYPPGVSAKMKTNNSKKDTLHCKYKNK